MELVFYDKSKTAKQQEAIDLFSAEVGKSNQFSAFGKDLFLFEKGQLTTLS